VFSQPCNNFCLTNIHFQFPVHLVDSLSLSLSLSLALSLQFLVPSHMDFDMLFQKYIGLGTVPYACTMHVRNIDMENLGNFNVFIHSM
jgi:hypothetical protein